MKDKIELIIIWIFVIFVFIGSLILGLLEPALDEPENEHQCTTFVKYQEHYQITPMTWYYRDSFKCVECGKDWKD